MGLKSNAQVPEPPLRHDSGTTASVAPPPLGPFYVVLEKYQGILEMMEPPEEAAPKPKMPPLPY
jgi:hypothetical protein